ncbi:unnamed protein product [Rhizopus microsporus]
MTLIRGTIGKLDNLLKYAAHVGNQQVKDRDPKRRRIDLEKGIELVFPIELIGIGKLPSDQHRSLLQLLMEHQSHAIKLNWDYVDMSESVFVRMTATSPDNLILWENECVVMQQDMNACYNKIQDERQLFAAVALAAKSKLLFVNDIKLFDNSGLCTTISITIDSKSKSNVLVKSICDFMQKEQEESESSQDSSLEAFFDTLRPPVSDYYLDNYTSEQVVSHLAPFQTQNVQWMLKREGHCADTLGNVCPLSTLYEQPPLLHKYINGSLVNQVTGEEVNDAKRIKALQMQSYRGGVLADEMGLGKTVCVISLLSKHRHSKDNPFHPQEAMFPDLTISSATLIIAPGPIIGQWSTEIKKHAPGLRVYVYNGRANNDTIAASELAAYDVVLTHYETFRTEINHSEPPPERPRRQAVKYIFQLSPLVSILWFRCVLDEAQMIEANFTRVSKMAKRIPRWYSWAVSGTPMKKKYTDLYGIYEFLQIETTFTPQLFAKCVNDKRLWPVFLDFAKTTIRRNTKWHLENQIRIPKQHRHVVRVPFSTIEQHYYDDLWRKCRDDLHLEWLDSINWTLPSNASPEMATMFNSTKLRMRAWLLALRQNCIHPSVITNDSMRIEKKLTGSNNQTDVQSLWEVLEYMRKSAEETLDNHQHAYYKLKLKSAGMHEVLKDWKAALDGYLASIPKVVELEQYHSSRVQRHMDKNKHLSNAEEEESNRKLGVLKANHNRWLILLHQFYFYTAGVYHILGQEDMETLYYNKAGDIRRVILEKVADKVDTTMKDMQKASQRFVSDEGAFHVGGRNFEIDLSILQEVGDEGDEEIEEDAENKELRAQYDANAFENVRNIGIVLDKQLEKIFYLRGKLLPFLTQKLVDQGDSTETSATGEEYSNSLYEQEMCQVYLNAYQALLQDRKFIIKGTVPSISELITGDVENGEYMSEEARRIQSVESSFRKHLKHNGSFRIECIKDTEQYLRKLRSDIENVPETEAARAVISEQCEWMRTVVHTQTKLIDYLDDDVRKISSLLNARIAYYKHLQQISDTLLEWESPNPIKEIMTLKKNEEQMEELIAQAKSRSQYFQVLTEEQSLIHSSGRKVQKDCLICQEPIEKGMITYW